MKTLPQEKDAAFWARTAADPAFAPMIEQVRRMYDRYAGQPIPPLPYSLRRMYHINGDRAQFEQPYFARRGLLGAAGVLGLLYPQQPEYRDTVQDLIWAICEEYCWALPAHTDGTLEDEKTKIDLFASETAFALGEIDAFYGDRLEAKVRERLREEVWRRVFVPYLSRRFGWEEADNNWAAVCANSMGGAMMYLAPELLRAQLPRLLKSMQCFVDSYADDGACLEGLSYWNCGFGHFVSFADLLYRFTDGATDLLADPKVRRCATFAQKNFLMGNTTVSFSDGERHGKVNAFAQAYLHERWPQDVLALPADMQTMTDNVYWIFCLRSFCYAKPAAAPARPTPATWHLPLAGQYITTRRCYSLALKAGHNAEPHNHNDIGSFLLATANGQELCDIGSGRYTREYFDPATRYDVLCNRSLGHSVPHIDGAEQPAGRRYAGELRVEGDTVTVEMAGAYDLPALRQLKRTFTLREAGLTLRDEWDIVTDGFVERFVSPLPPTLLPGEVRLAALTLHYDAALATAHVSTAQHMPHDRNDGNAQTMYLIDLALPRGVQALAVAMTVKKA